MSRALNQMINSQLLAGERECRAAEAAMATEYRANGEAAGRTYLKVAYANKDHAKRNGAKWDPAGRAWYVVGPIPSSLSCYA